MKTIAMSILVLSVCSACAFITTATGSLVGNIGADIVQEKGLFSDKDAKAKEK